MSGYLRLECLLDQGRGSVYLGPSPSSATQNRKIVRSNSEIMSARETGDDSGYMLGYADKRVNSTDSAVAFCDISST